MATVALLMVGDFMIYRGSKTNNTPQFLRHLPSTRPISNNIHIGIANSITPVPGGVGPMTIIMLLSNTVASAEKCRKLEAIA